MESNNTLPISLIVVGCGNVASALLRGLATTDLNVHVYCKGKTPSCPKARATSIAFNVDLYYHHLPSLHSKLANEETRIIWLITVKPYQVRDTLFELADEGWLRHPNEVVVSVAAGYPTSLIHDDIEAATSSAPPQIVRAMPSITTAVSKGVTGLYSPDPILPEINLICSAIGDVLELPSDDAFHTFSAVAASLPAFIFVAIEALSDSAVLNGMKRDEALWVISKTIEAAAAFSLSGKQHPGRLKDLVTSPGGTTIFGIQALEESGFRASLIKAISSTIQRSRDLEDKLLS